MVRCCKVISTCFIPREIREDTTIMGWPPGFFKHSQNFPDEYAVLALVKLNIEIENTVAPGLPVDTIIVNNDSGWEPGKRFLDSCNGAPSKTGKLKVLHRENYGRSFGGYNAAFEAFEDCYDYWLFTEDDILLNGNYYYSKLVSCFERKKNTGFVAAQALSSAGLDSESNLLHAHGGVGLSHRRVLQKVKAEQGYLPHCRKGEPQDFHSIVRNGEIAFTHVIDQMGFGLVDDWEVPPVYEYGYDYMRKIPPRANTPGSIKTLVYYLSKKTFVRVRGFLRFLLQKWKKKKPLPDN